MCEHCGDEVEHPIIYAGQEDYLGFSISAGSFCSNECLTNHIKEAIKT